MSKGYIFMRFFKNKSDAIISISRYLCILILIVFCGVLYSCQRKGDDSGIKIEQAGDQISDEGVDESANGNVDVGNDDASSNNTGNIYNGNDDYGNSGISNSEGHNDNSKIICVHIIGYVTNPGVYDVKEGARIYEVIRLAGGFLPEADESYLNLASVVFDGQKIEVLSKEEAKTAKPFVDSSLTETSKKLVNINTATKEELMQLPGIGESRALSIIAYRDKNGEFKKITDIMKISGIKEAAFEKIKDYICVE